MQIVNILDICDIQVGKTPSRSNPLYWGKGGLWLSIRDMNQGLNLQITKETITEKAIKETKMKIVPVNTVLFSFKLSIGKVGITKVPMYTNEAIAAFIIKDMSKLDTKFLYYVLKGTDHSIGSNRAVMGKTLNKEILKQIRIPLPPLEDQKRIVKVLDQGDMLCQKREQSIRLMDDYLKAVFLEMFGDPVINPKKWEKKEFHKICSKILGGGTPSKANSNFYKGNVLWVTPKDMKKRFLEDSEDKISEEAVANSSVKIIPKMSVLMVIRSGILKHKLPVAINRVEVTVNQDMKAYIIDQKLSNAYFVLFFFEVYQNHLLKKVRAVTADNLKFDDIKNIQMIIPPTELQNKFAEIVCRIELLKQKMLIQADELETQFQALMRNAFSSKSI